MECIYFPELTKYCQLLTIEGLEAKHLFVLRLKPGDAVFVTNGVGLCCSSEIISSGKALYKLKPIEYYEDYGELTFRLGLAIGILDNRERFEYALEKSVEMGIMDFFPISADFCSKDSINITRLYSKAITAIKQCKRARLPVIHEPTALSSLMSLSKDYKNLLLGDIGGAIPSQKSIEGSALAIIGPEGGFSDDEMKVFSSDNRLIKWKLSNTRLRAETAAIALLSCAYSVLSK